MDVASSDGTKHEIQGYSHRPKNITHKRARVIISYRRLGLAKTLMDYFEDVSIKTYNAYFVDLFVRASNTLAIKMYEKFGYSTYRRVLGYYSGELPEDALDMRKALPR